MTVFPQVDPLPSAENEPAVAEGNTEAHRRECSADVCRHVVRPLARMDMRTISIRRQLREEAFQIGPDIRIRIFLD